MSFTDEQRAALKSKLSYRHVRSRLSDGVVVPYVEGWHVIAEANRIFGHDGWDRTTVEPRCVWRDVQRGHTTCFYTAKVCVRVTANGSNIVREGIGTGTGRSPAPEIAHEIALKAAETDATKRALATFGNPFGLALYDKAQQQVTRSRHRTLQSTKEPKLAPLALALLVDHDRRVELHRAEDYVAAVQGHLPSVATLDELYSFWEMNIEGLNLLRRQESGHVQTIVQALKARARELGQSVKQASANGQAAHPAARKNVPANRVEGGMADDVITVCSGPSASHSMLAEDTHAAVRDEAAAQQILIPKDKRIRDKAHLAFVARQPCLICGRKPAHAHHLRFAQSRAMAMKVSDEFTLPLCAGHHDDLHRAGDERIWWTRQGIKAPLDIAARLWTASRLGSHEDDHEEQA